MADATYFRQFPGAYKVRFFNYYAGDGIQSYSEQVFDVPVYFGVLKRWDGSNWIKASLKVFNGVSFDIKPLKVYDGTVFQLVDTSEV